MSEKVSKNKMAQEEASLHVKPVDAPVRGHVDIAGDKSISHRALIFASLASGRSSIAGLCEGRDVMMTMDILRQLGVRITRQGAAWQVDGCGIGGLSAPANVLDCGNSGTTARLMMGVLAAHDLQACLTGDRSLRRRPMGHVMAPLEEMGARFAGSDARLPLWITGTKSPLPIEFHASLPSAQLKSAVMLAGLAARGETAIIEARPTRDHTERMIRGFGGQIDSISLDDGGVKIVITGEPELQPKSIIVPGDPSSAAFIAALAVLTEKSELIIERVGVNPHRMGFYEVLKEMGAQIEILPREREGDIDEPVADIKVFSSHLSGIDISAARAAEMIDEYPILSIAAACADGATHMRGLSQLRVKESDRLAAIARNLQSNGIAAEIHGDDLTIIGCGGAPPGGGDVITYDDHRIAMAFLVLGACAQNGVTIDDGSMINTSFPDFIALMRRLGVEIASPA